MKIEELCQEYNRVYETCQIDGGDEYKAAKMQAIATLAGREAVKRALYALYFAPEKMYKCPLELRNRWVGNFKYGAPAEYWGYKNELYITLDRICMCSKKFDLPDVMDALPNGRHVINKEKVLDADRTYHFLTNVHEPTEGDVIKLAQEIYCELCDKVA